MSIFRPELSKSRLIVKQWLHLQWDSSKHDTNNAVIFLMINHQFSNYPFTCVLCLPFPLLLLFRKQVSRLDFINCCRNVKISRVPFPLDVLAKVGFEFLRMLCGERALSYAHTLIPLHQILGMQWWCLWTIRSNHNVCINVPPWRLIRTPLATKDLKVKLSG